MSSKFSFRLSLESLDGRIVPSTSPVQPDVSPEYTTAAITVPEGPMRRLEQIKADIKSLQAVIDQAVQKSFETKGALDELTKQAKLAQNRANELTKAAVALVSDPNAALGEKTAALAQAAEAEGAANRLRTAALLKAVDYAQQLANLRGLESMMRDLQAEYDYTLDNTIPCATDIADAASFAAYDLALKTDIANGTAFLAELELALATIPGSQLNNEVGIV